MPCYPRGDSEESGSHTGQAFEEEGKRRHGRALVKEVWVCKCVFLIVASNRDFHVRPVSGKESAGLCPWVR